MKIINVFKTHFDIGFTDLSKNVIDKYSTKMLHEVLDVCDKTVDSAVGKKFVWTMAAWPLITSLKLCCKEDYQRALFFIKNGQIAIHALPFTIHTESLGEGDLLHLFDARNEAVEKYGCKMPISAKMTDVPGHSIAIVETLYKNGVKFLHLGCNPASLFPDVPTMFWWENSSGHRVLTFYNKTYGSSLYPPKDWKYPVWLSIQQTNDNLGPQDFTILNKIENEIASELPESEVIFGTLDDFYNEIIKYNLDDLPVIKTDLGDTWIHGIGSYPKELGLIRRARNVVFKSKLTEEDERNFYENSLLFSEHTWGADVKTYLTWQRSYEKEKFNEERKLERYKFVEKSWDEQRERANKCAKIASKYGILFSDSYTASLNNEVYEIKLINGLITIVNKIKGRKIVLDYKYRIIGTQTMTDFMRHYLTRFYSWALSDFGRDSYGEVNDYSYGINIIDSKVVNGGLEATYSVDSTSYEKFGNAKKIVITAGIVAENVLIRVKLLGKEATPYIESGDLFFNTNSDSDEYFAKKINYSLNCKTDICKNANQILFAVNDDVSIGDVHINPIDSPLVSFGESAIFKYNGGTFKKPTKNSIVFNLFNNQWGTNFPQWIEGDLIFDYILQIK